MKFFLWTKINYLYIYFRTVSIYTPSRLKMAFENITAWQRRKNTWRFQTSRYVIHGGKWRHPFAAWLSLLAAAEATWKQTASESAAGSRRQSHTRPDNTSRTIFYAPPPFCGWGNRLIDPRKGFLSGYYKGGNSTLVLLKSFRVFVERRLSLFQRQSTVLAFIALRFLVRLAETIPTHKLHSTVPIGHLTTHKCWIKLQRRELTTTRTIARSTLSHDLKYNRLPA